MLLNLIDKKIRQSFSDAAYEYDILTSLQKEIGRELSRKVINNDDIDAVLDVGMGTGWLTNRISFFLPESQIIGLDFAPGMIDVAKKKEDIQIVQANALRLPFKDELFDVVISNLAYQWVNDLSAAFGEVNRVLKDEGKIYFTLFGYETFKELFEALAETKNGSPGLPLRRLDNEEEIIRAIDSCGFKEIRTESEYIKVRFPDMLGLLKWIKDIGANSLAADVFLGKEWLFRANTYYEEHFKDRLGIYTTFEVVWVEANK